MFETNSLKDKVLFISVGQGGGNLGKEFENKGYTSFYINTSMEDLSTVTDNPDFRFHIPASRGCNKDRNKAQEYMRAYYDRILNIVSSRFGTFTKIFVVFSTGGGTGSGLGPYLAHILGESLPHCSVGAICILPAQNESLKTKDNALKCIEELSSVESIKNVYILDNHNADKFYINSRFAERMDSLLNISRPDVRGNIDIAEVETLLNVKGNVVFADLTSEAEGLFNQFSIDSIFTLPVKGSQYLAYSLKDDKDFLQTEVEKQFGEPYDFFKGYNPNSSFVVAFGLPFPKIRMEEIQFEVENGVDAFNKRDKVQGLSFGVNATVMQPQQKEPAKPKAMNDILGSFGARK